MESDGSTESEDLEEDGVHPNGRAGRGDRAGVFADEQDFAERSDESSPRGAGAEAELPTLPVLEERGVDTRAVAEEEGVTAEDGRRQDS